MNDDAIGSAGVEPVHGSAEGADRSSVRHKVSAGWLALEDAKRILQYSSRWEAQEAHRLIVEAQGELEGLAEAVTVGEGEPRGEAVHG